MLLGEKGLGWWEVGIAQQSLLTLKKGTKILVYSQMSPLQSLYNHPFP